LSAELELHGNAELREALLDCQRARLKLRMTEARFRRKSFSRSFLLRMRF
jgi:hypothetical protein